MLVFSITSPPFLAGATDTLDKKEGDPSKWSKGGEHLPVLASLGLFLRAPRPAASSGQPLRIRCRCWGSHSDSRLFHTQAPSQPASRSKPGARWAVPQGRSARRTTAAAVCAAPPRYLSSLHTTRPAASSGQPLRIRCRCWLMLVFQPFHPPLPGANSSNDARVAAGVPVEEIEASNAGLRFVFSN